MQHRQRGTDIVTGSGNIITKDYDVKGFSRVTLAGSGNVYITQGSTESLSVETDDNIFAQLDIRVRGDELILGTKPAVGINPSQPIKYQLTVKDLNNITLGGSGNMYSDPIQTDNMQVMLGGSGNIEVKGMSGRKSFRQPRRVREYHRQPDRRLLSGYFHQWLRKHQAGRQSRRTNHQREWLRQIHGR